MTQDFKTRTLPDNARAGSTDDQLLLFCIGAQKAGTTWLQAQLEPHPSAFFALPKELHYWDCIRAPYFTEFRYRTARRFNIPDHSADLRHRLSRLWRPDIRARQVLAAEYSKIFEGEIFDHSRYLDYLGRNTSANRIIGDFTPGYALLGRDTFKEMLDCHPNVKFVFVMRDPVARLWSGIQQRYRAKILRKKVRAEDVARVFEQTLRNPHDPDFLRSSYQLTITELEASVPQDRIQYCVFENLLDAERGEHSRDALCRFIGLPDVILDAGEKVNSAAASWDLPHDLADEARSTLRHVYDFVGDRFDADLIASWRT